MQAATTVRFDPEIRDQLDKMAGRMISHEEMGAQLRARGFNV